MVKAGFRRPEGEEEQSAASLELFYDLVFVFAITQISHLLLAHLTWSGVGQAAIVLLAVWWSWNYTTWATNELDPESGVVRLLLLALMMLSLLMAIAVPEAFGDNALLFACCYVAIQIGRHAFLAFAAAAKGTVERERAARILTWFAAAGVLWIAGAIVGGELRTGLWVAALVVDYGGPLILFRLPGRRPLPGDTWQVKSSHFSERFELFVIIALGESIVMIGATTAGLALDATTVAALAGAFVGSAALWSLYFRAFAEIAENALSHQADRTLLARDVYTYGHVLIVGAIILSAVADELVITHHGEVLDTAQLLVVVAAPALYLLVQAALVKRMIGVLRVPLVAGAGACALVGLSCSALPALAVAALVLAITVAVAVSEERGERGSSTARN
ncbi:MAG: low temperature requirement protein A [Actinobacteria bacterium]|nr:low temperature requirement protein A [Actinomycetota bacterium]